MRDRSYVVVLWVKSRQKLKILICDDYNNNYTLTCNIYKKSGSIFIVDKSSYKYIHFTKFIYRLSLFFVEIYIMVHKSIFQIAYQYQFFLSISFDILFIYLYKSIK